MKPIAFWSIALALSVFGMMTVFLTGSVIFDLFNIRSHEGDYVLFVVWANLISGLLFLTAALGFVKRKTWTTMPLGVSAIILILALLGLIVHIYSGGAYESKTVGAMILRIVINAVLVSIIHFTSRPRDIGHLIKKGMFFFIPVLIVGSACSSPADKTDNHAEMSAKDHHQHQDETEVSTIELDHGAKWNADENTLQLVRKMEDEVLVIETTTEPDYKTLADSLRKDIDLLIAGCTMEGRAHEELHKWLLPHIDYVKSLSNAKNKTEANEILNELNESFNVFNQSFQ